MMEISRRKSVIDNLRKFCFSSTNEEDTIEVTEWANGDGVDVSITRGDNTSLFTFSYEELDAVNYLVKVLAYEKENA